LRLHAQDAAGDGDSIEGHGEALGVGVGALAGRSLGVWAATSDAVVWPKGLGDLRPLAWGQTSDKAIIATATSAIRGKKRRSDMGRSLTAPGP